MRRHLIDLLGVAAVAILGLVIVAPFAPSSSAAERAYPEPGKVYVLRDGHQFTSIEAAYARACVAFFETTLNEPSSAAAAWDGAVAARNALAKSAPTPLPPIVAPPVPSFGTPGPVGPPGAQGVQGPPGRDGKDADPAAVAALRADLTALTATVDALVSVVEHLGTETPGPPPEEVPPASTPPTPPPPVDPPATVPPMVAGTLVAGAAPDTPNPAPAPVDGHFRLPASTSRDSVTIVTPAGETRLHLWERGSPQQVELSLDGGPWLAARSGVVAMPELPRGRHVVRVVAWPETGTSAVYTPVEFVVP